MKREIFKKCTERKMPVEVVESVVFEIYMRVRRNIVNARAKVYAIANKRKVLAYWNVLCEINKDTKNRAKYGDGLIWGLSTTPADEFCSGYAWATLRFMRLIRLADLELSYMCDKLNWPHYQENYQG